MLDFELTVTNYRCFSASNPARLEMRSRIMGLLGPNNAGKSTLLRLFFECRQTFSLLNDENAIRTWAQGGAHGVQLLGAGDPVEIFHNANDIPVRLELRIVGAGESQLSGVEFSFRRSQPNAPYASFRVGPSHEEVVLAQNKFPNAVVNGREVVLDASLLRQLGRELSNAMYLPATRVAIGEAQGNAYDLQFGSTFIGQWDSWKTGPNRAQNDVIQKITEDIRKLFGFGRLEITATPDNRDLHLAVDGKPFKLRELGGGLAQFIIVLANVGVRRPSWLLIDEPEISLHPSLQLEFLTTLASYTSAGTLFATHSMGLARSADAVVSVQKGDGVSIVRAFEATNSFPEFLGEMSFSAYRDLGYDTVLVVEGVNDIKTVQQFLRLLGKDHRVVILQLGGSQLIRPQRAQELSETLRLTRNVYALIDSERTLAEQPLMQPRAQFLAACAALTIRSAATERRAFEHYISDRAAKVTFGDKYRGLTPFEDRAAVAPIWAKSETWRAAREMTRAELLETDVGQFLNRI